jgi:hypothetical protein
MCSRALYNKKTLRVEGNSLLVHEAGSTKIDTPSLLWMFNIKVALFRIVGKVFLTTDKTGLKYI